MNAVDFARELIDIDSTTGREQEAGRVAVAQPSLARLPRRRAAGRQRPAQRRRHARFADRGPLHALRLCAPAFRELDSRRPPVRPRLVRREGHPRRAGGGGRTAARSRERHRVGMLFVVGEERGSDGADVANASPHRIAVPHQRRADRQPARDRDARQPPRAAAGHRPGRTLGGSGARDIGHRQAAGRARAAPLRSRCPADPELGRTYYSIGLIEGGVAPNVISAARQRRGHVPDDRAP